MMSLTRKVTLRFLILIVLLGTMSSSCVYFNTFYNARKAFNEAESARKKSRGARSGGAAQYRKAIDKATKVVEEHPNSKWYDDALYVLGVSFFYTKEYSKAERRFREILANYPDSKYSRESILYLAKSKLEQGDSRGSLEIFDDIFQGNYDRNYKTEAAMALGYHHFNEKRYSEAETYFRAIRDSLGNAEEIKLAQQNIADGYFEQFRFDEALKAYLQLLGLNPTNDERYHALYQSAICSYRLQRIDVGINYLNTLINDEVYYDSLGSLKLALAEGYEADGDLLQAEIIYEQVVNGESKKKNVATAYYYLGLTYQYDYDDLIRAKEYYDKAVEANRSSPIALDALQRSSDIGKLSTYSRTLEIDSTTTQEMIDEAAATQYSLAELYWFNLDKPDTAILELQYLLDSFSTSYLVPKALIAMADMSREYTGDSTRADSLLNLVLTDYASSDYAEEAIAALGLKGTEADTGYAGYYLAKAEKALVDDKDWKTAEQNYQKIVSDFPDSRYYLHSRFSLIWLQENYASPGDSTLIFAYSALADSFPGSRWAMEATRRTNYRTPVVKPPPEKFVEGKDDEIRPGSVATADEEQAALTDNADTEEGTYNDPRLTLYVGPNGDTIVLLEQEPERTDEEFEYPSQAYGDFDQDFYLYFQILLDFSGKVNDYILKIRSENEEVNERVSRTVASMTFDPLIVSTKVVDYNLQADPSGGYWFVYKYLVKVPDFLK